MPTLSCTFRIEQGASLSVGSCMIYQAQAELPFWIYFHATLNLHAIPPKICSLQKLWLAHPLCVAEVWSRNALTGLWETRRWVPRQPACRGMSRSSSLFWARFWPWVRMWRVGLL